MLFGFTASTFPDMVQFGMISASSWNGIRSEGIVPGSVLRMIRTTGRSEMCGYGHVGKVMQHSFPDEMGPRNRYRWDAIRSDGDLYNGDGGGHGIYISTSRDRAVLYGRWRESGSGQGPRHRREFPAAGLREGERSDSRDAYGFRM